MSHFLEHLVFYLVPLVGAVAVFLAMPARRDVVRIAPMVLGAIALGAMVGLLTKVFGHSRVVFYVLAVLAVLAAARVITHRKPVYSAVYFLLLVVSVAGIAIQAGAEFLGAALIIIYAGAILVTYVFVIMLAQQPTPPEHDIQPREPLLAVLAGFVLIGVMTGVMAKHYGPPAMTPAATAPGRPVVTSAPTDATETWTLGNTMTLGTELMSTYVVAFETAGVLLLVGILGGISLATGRLVDPGESAEGGTT